MPGSEAIARQHPFLVVTTAAMLAPRSRSRAHASRAFLASALPLSIVLALLGFSPAPVASAAKAVTTIYVANAGNPSTVTVVDGATDAVKRSIPIGTYIAVGVGVAPDGKEAYAIATGSDEQGSPGRLVAINTATNVAGKAINVGTDPQSIAFNPDGKFAYVVNGFDAATTPANAPGTITPVNLAEGSAGKPIKVGTNPGEMAISPNGRIAYVADSNALYRDPDCGHSGQSLDEHPGDGDSRRRAGDRSHAERSNRARARLRTAWCRSLRRQTVLVARSGSAVFLRPSCLLPTARRRGC